MEPQDTSMTNLIINYLPQSMTDKKLHQMFTQVGQIEACRVMKDVKVSLSSFVVFICFFSFFYTAFTTVDGCLSHRRCRRGRPRRGEGAHACRINGLPGGKTRFIFYISSRFSPLSYVRARTRARVCVCPRCTRQTSHALNTNSFRSDKTYDARSSEYVICFCLIFLFLSPRSLLCSCMVKNSFLWVPLHDIYAVVSFHSIGENVRK